MAFPAGGWPSRALGKEQVATFELAPLRRSDVHLAAEIEEIDPAAFLLAIEEKGAQPLAIKPVTLRFLINVYRRDGRLPAKQPDLYHQGCQLLVAETSQSRASPESTRHLFPGSRRVGGTFIAAPTHLDSGERLLLIGRLLIVGE